MCIVTAHAGADSLEQAVLSWTGKLPKGWNDFPEHGSVPPSCQYASVEPNLFVMDGRNGMLPAYQYAFDWAKSSFDVLAYIHDDLIIHDPFWHEKVLAQFEDPKVGLVGFGGATGHGDPGMYKKPYEYQQLARRNFCSNMRDAEAHGKRFAGARDAAVLDGFALIVRRDLLEKAGGWPLSTPIGYVCYDYWLSCITRRLGYKIRVVGVACDHLGGRTFVKLGIGQDPKHWQQYVDSHRYIYDEFKDVLPYEVP